MIVKDLLRLTEYRAVGTVVYGAGGVRKTLAVHTLVPPILHHDFEGGTASLQPWIRRRRRWNESNWTVVSQEEREATYSLLPFKPEEMASGIKPTGYIDVINYDNLNPQSHMEFIRELGSFEPSRYNTISLDSLAELSFSAATYSKNLVKMDVMDSMANASPWAAIQERTAIALRKMRNYRDQGVYIYIIAQESIDKDYVTDPRSKKQGELQPEPYSVKGTVAVPGQIVNVVQHITDLMFRARSMSGKPIWVCKPEPITAGSGANWEAKDRWGRIPSDQAYLVPNFRTIMKYLYGPEGAVAIYDSGKDLLTRS